MLRVALETLAHRAVLSLRETTRLGRYGWYWRLRAALALAELREPAWRVARREGPGTGLSEEDLTYGETPLLTAFEILSELQAGPDDVVADLGAGRGQVLHLARLAFGCRGEGLEALPTLVDRARKIAAVLQLTGVEFQQRDFRAAKLPRATIYLVQPTTLDERSWGQVSARLKKAPPGSRAVSLSVPIPGWEVRLESRRAYSWGWCTVFLQVR